MTLPNLNPEQKEDYYNVIMYRLFDIGICDAVMFLNPLLANFNNINLCLVQKGYSIFHKSTIHGIIQQFDKPQLMNIQIESIYHDKDLNRENDNLHQLLLNIIEYLM